MAYIPWKPVFGISVLASILLVGVVPQYHVFKRPSYLGTFSELFILQFAAWAVWRMFLWPHFLSPIRHLPGPKGNSFFHGQWGKIRAEPSGAPMLEWMNTIPNDGLIRYLGMFNSERLLITSPKALSEVLTTKNYDFMKPQTMRDGIGRLLGVGILLAEGDEHRLQRKNLMPAFAFRHIKDLYPVFWEKSKEVVEAMTAQVETGLQKKKESSDIEKTLTGEDQVIMEAHDWASRATLDIIGVAGMGQDFGAIKDENTPLFSTYRQVFKPTSTQQILQLISLFIPGWIFKRLPFKRNGEIDQAANVIKSTARQLIRAKKEKLEKNELKDVDILSVALESGSFTEENLVNQLMTFLAAGHETTASAMTWAVYMLCRYPEWQTRLRDEVRAKLPSPSSSESSSTITSVDIDHLPQLNAFCNEVLRYWSPVPLTVRETAHTTTVLGQTIPGGTKVFLVPWAINKSRALWGEDSTSFRPERWLDSATGGASSNYAFMTFLHGPRSCIGQAFSKAEFLCLLGAWVGRFEFELRDKEMVDERNIEIKGGVTARPAKGLWVKVKVVPGW